MTNKLKREKIRSRIRARREAKAKERRKTYLKMKHLGLTKVKKVPQTVTILHKEKIQWLSKLSKFLRNLWTGFTSSLSLRNKSTI